MRIKFQLIALSAFLLAFVSPTLFAAAEPLEVCWIGQRGGDCNKAPSGFGRRLISYAEMETGGTYRCTFFAPTGGVIVNVVSMRDGAARFTTEPQLDGSGFGPTPQTYLVKVHSVPTPMGLDVGLRAANGGQPSFVSYCDRIAK